MTTRSCRPQPQCRCYPLNPLLCLQMAKIPRTFLQNWNIFLRHITSASTWNSIPTSCRMMQYIPFKFQNKPIILHGIKNPKDNCQYIACPDRTSSVSPQHNWSLLNSIHYKWAANRWSVPLMTTQFHQHQLPAPRHGSKYVTYIFICCCIHITAMVYVCDPASFSVAFFNNNTVATI